MHDELKPYAEHLTYLGYVLDADEVEATRFKHKTHFNFRVRRFRGGFLFTVALPIEPALVAKNESEYYKAINAINARNIVARIFDHKNTSLQIESWYPPSYNRQDFPMFITNWNVDLDRLLTDHFKSIEPFMTPA